MVSNTKVCSKCKIEKPESSFGKNKRMADGLDYYCKECRTGYNPDTYRDNTMYIESLKTSCVKCGEDRPYLIQFHHVNNEDKLFEVTKCGNRSKSSIWKEISKCVCLCANCHKEFHHFYGNKPEKPIKSLQEYLDS